MTARLRSRHSPEQASCGQLSIARVTSAEQKAEKLNSDPPSLKLRRDKKLIPGRDAPVERRTARDNLIYERAA